MYKSLQYGLSPRVTIVSECGIYEPNSTWRNNHHTRCASPTLTTVLLSPDDLINALYGPAPPPSLHILLSRRTASATKLCWMRTICEVHVSTVGQENGRPSLSRTNTMSLHTRLTNTSTHRQVFVRVSHATVPACVLRTPPFLSGCCFAGWRAHVVAFWRPGSITR